MRTYRHGGEPGSAGPRVGLHSNTLIIRPWIFLEKIKLAEGIINIVIGCSMLRICIIPSCALSLLPCITFPNTGGGGGGEKSPHD